MRDAMGNTSDGNGLVRHIGLFSLVVYGVGDMVGAGIYGTIGVAAGALGNAVWLSFVVSMVAALLSGLSYASLGSRHPRAGGAATITLRAYRKPFLSYVVGLSVAASGLTSMAAGANVFSGTLSNFIPQVPFHLVIVGFISLLTIINLIGIKESMAANLVCTIIEVAGLLFVIVVGMRFWGSVDYLQTATGEGINISMLLSGAVLTFFAFIGFEDMLNVSEEVKSPERTLPWAIIIALTIATIFYLAISITAVSVVDSAKLADAKLGAPLAQITAVAAPWVPGWIYPAITLFAVGNTALLNYVMGSRLLYGMARQGLVPARLGSVHARFRTPHLAIFTLGSIVLLLAMIGNIGQLASATSLLLLGCFCLVNISLIILKLRPGEPRGSFEIPILVPVLGAFVCSGLIYARVSSSDTGMEGLPAPAIAGLLVVGISALYFVVRPASKSLESAES